MNLTKPGFYEKIIPLLSYTAAKQRYDLLTNRH
jgi:hypothetical protein